MLPMNSSKSWFSAGINQQADVLRSETNFFWKWTKSWWKMAENKWNSLCVLHLDPVLTATAETQICRLPTDVPDRASNLHTTSGRAVTFSIKLVSISRTGFYTVSLSD
jgi:hypothetical protein